MTNNRQIIFGYLFALGATAIWSGNFIIARAFNQSIPPVTLAFLRWTVAVIAFFPFAIKALIAEKDILAKNIPYLIITSFLGVSLFNTLVYIAGHTTTAFNISLISITFPIFVIIFSRFFFGDLITLNKGIGIILVITGVVFLITKGDFSKLLNLTFAIGDIWVLVAAISFAIYSILLKRKPKELSINAFQLSNFFLGLTFLLPFFVWERASAPPLEFDVKMIFAILYLGIFAALTAFILWNKAVEVTGPTKAGMVYYTVPLFSGVLAYIILGEKIGLTHLYSAVLILAGILIANREK